MPTTSRTYARIGRVNYYARRQKNIRLSLSGAEIRLSYPRHVSLKKAEAFLLARTDWIVKNKPPAPRLADGAAIGRRHRLRLDDRCRQPQLRGRTIWAADADDEATVEMIKKVIQKEAEEQLPALIGAAVETTGLRPRKIRIRYMKSQWGSCTSSKNVAFNSALVYLPDRLIEYVIVHELCHLSVLSHSDRFWQLVGRQLPDYQQRRRALRGYRIGPVVGRP